MDDGCNGMLAFVARLVRPPLIFRFGLHMRTALKWNLLIVAAVVITSIPTRLGSHDVALGVPFTWHTRQEVVTFGEQPHSFNAAMLLADFCTSLLVLSAVARLLRKRPA